MADGPARTDRLLFENMVVIEALKCRLNRGKRSNLYFWRDGKGNEVDLLIEAGPDVMPVEIKAGATISRDFFKGLHSFAARLPWFMAEQNNCAEATWTSGGWPTYRG